jgi:pimeloyl-ACP methyl ester carboxylesterase
LSGDLDQTLSAFDQANEDARVALAWLSSRPNIDANRIGAVGVSVGALLSVRLLADAPQLRFGVLILGGGGVRTLLQQSIIARGVRDELVRKKVDLAKAIQRLQKIDPVTYAPRVRDREILMIDAIYDTVIPPDTARELWQALGKPELIWIPTGHLGALFHKRPLIDEGLRFVESTLGENASNQKNHVRFKNLMSPKLGIVGLTNGEVRPAYVGELFRFDRRGKVALDLGVMPFRILTGVSVNVSSLGGFGWGDMSVGIAMRPERVTRMYFGLNVHF